MRESLVRVEVDVGQERFEEGRRHLSPLVWDYRIAIAVSLENLKINKIVYIYL